LENIYGDLQKNGQKNGDDAKLKSLIDAANVSKDQASAAALHETLTFQRLAANASDPWITFAGVAAKAGRHVYKFAEPPNYKDAKESRASESFSVVLGRYQANAQRFYTFSIQQVRKYKEQDAVQRCKPTDNPQVSVCNSIAGGAPARQDSTIGDLVVNWHFTDRLGIAPRIARDIKQKVTAVSVPLYFIPSTPKKGEASFLNGGISFDWNSKDKEFIVAVFVGQFAKLPPFIKP